MAEEGKKQQDALEQYGRQGNEGQYGQGQYTLEGKPDPHGPQGQEMEPEVPEAENADGQQINRDAYSRQNDLEQAQSQQKRADDRQKKQEGNAQKQGQMGEGMIQKG